MMICLDHFFGIRLLLSQLDSTPPQETLRPCHVKGDRPAILGEKLGLPDGKIQTIKTILFKLHVKTLTSASTPASPWRSPKTWRPSPLPTPTKAF